MANSKFDPSNQQPSPFTPNRQCLIGAKLTWRTKEPLFSFSHMVSLSNALNLSPTSSKSQKTVLPNTPLSCKILSQSHFSRPPFSSNLISRALSKKGHSLTLSSSSFSLTTMRKNQVSQRRQISTPSFKTNRTQKAQHFFIQSFDQYVFLLRRLYRRSQSVQ